MKLCLTLTKHFIYFKYCFYSGISLSAGHACLDILRGFQREMPDFVEELRVRPLECDEGRADEGKLEAGVRGLDPKHLLFYLCCFGFLGEKRIHGLVGKDENEWQILERKVCKVPCCTTVSEVRRSIEKTNKRKFRVLLLCSHHNTLLSKHVKI